MNKMQTIIGAGGAIGIELAKALTAYTTDIRLVGRSPRKVNETDIVHPADVLQPSALKQAIRGSEIIYVTVGFPYSYKVWKQNWPEFVKNLLSACEEEDCKLVFFDNVYMYDMESLNPMTEEAKISPPSKKGEVRRVIADMIMDSDVKALIARSADFYGPCIKDSSLLTETVFNPLSAKKTANWLVSDRCKHSFTYTPDAGKATALLGNTEKAYGQVWHLPTAADPPCGKEWVETIAEGLGTEPKYRVVSPLMVRILGLFIPIMRETYEMLYQYDRDYVFDSSKFEKAFDFRPTSYEDGIREILKVDYT
jgi:nucleoside-diphosphate-sugar epimerase